MSRAGWVAIGLGAGILLAAFAAPFAYPGDPYAIHTGAILQPPTAMFPLGTDDLGRDALARLLSAGFATLSVALPAALLTFVAGTGYGLLAALGPGWLDALLMRLLDAVLALPSLVVLIVFAALLPLNDFTLILLVGSVTWPPLARLVRNDARAQRQREFVLAARQFGAGPWYIARVHVLRMIAPLLVVNATLLVGDTIFMVSALSFLGLGVQPPNTSWGGLIQQSLGLLQLDPWWLILPPGVMIFASMLAASMLGQSLLARWDARS